MGRALGRRANWSCKPINYVPTYRDQGSFVAWNFGPSYKNWWQDVQFLTKNDYAWQLATGARHDEFDTTGNVQLQSDAAVDSGKLGDSIMYLTNSAGRLRAMVMATKSKLSNIEGIVTVERRANCDRRPVSFVGIL